MTEQLKTISIKGFNTDLKCRDFQFELGQTYEIAGNVKACKSGFHACPVEFHPLTVFQYYPPAGSRFAEVEQFGDTDSDDNKLASAKITIGVEITLHQLITRAVKWVFERAKPEGETATGDGGAASSTGYLGAASSTGDRGAASSTGDRGAASSTGDRGAASSTGGRGAASSTGYLGAASSTGYLGAASSTGDRGAASSTGDLGAASSTGDRGAASSTGDGGAASSTGLHSVALGSGYQSKAMAGETSAICLVHRNDDGEIVAIRASKVGENGVKPLAWYSLSADGEFVEIDQSEAKD